MIWPKKASKRKIHIGIVRANKREVNDFFNRDNHHRVCEKKNNLS
jgi:hypothetical protein